MEIFDVLTAYDWAVLVFGLSALGCAAGFMAGLLGVGGGIVLVPGLFFCFLILALIPMRWSMFVLVRLWR